MKSSYTLISRLKNLSFFTFFFLVFTYSLNAQQTGGEIFGCEDWTFLAGENETMELHGEEYVRFGAGGSYVIRKVTSGSPCNAATFGADPAPEYPKYCEVCREEGLTVSPLDQWVGPKAGSIEYYITTNDQWTITSEVPWLIVSQDIGFLDAYVTISITENTSTEPRSGSFTIFGPNGLEERRTINQEGGTTYECDNWTFVAAENETLHLQGEEYVRFGYEGNWITMLVPSGYPCSSSVFGASIASEYPRYCEVCQEEGNPQQELSVSPEDQFVDSAEGYIEFDIVTNGGWTITSQASWLIVSQDIGFLNGKVYVFFTENTSDNPRSATFTVSGDEGGEVVRTIVQDGKGQPENPGNPPSAGADFCDDFNEYQDGGLAFQSERWSKFADFQLDAEVTSSFSSDYGKSLLVEYNAWISDQPDILLNLGDLNRGAYELNFKMYIPYRKGAYFNSQKFEQLPGEEYGFQIFFNADSRAELQVGGKRVRFTYPQERWLDITLTFDLDRDQVSLYINRYYLYSWRASETVSSSRGSRQLGAINFFAYKGAQFFIDEVCMATTEGRHLGLRSATEEVEIITGDQLSPKPELPLSDLSAVAPATFGADLLPEEQGAILGQNYPNPVEVNTTIPLMIPQGSRDAFIEIVGSDGKVAKRIEVDETGSSQVSINSSNLTTGIYFYSLRVDGKLIETKRMNIVGIQ